MRCQPRCDVTYIRTVVVVVGIEYYYVRCTVLTVKMADHEQEYIYYNITVSRRRRPYVCNITP